MSRDQSLVFDRARSHHTLRHLRGFLWDSIVSATVYYCIDFWLIVIIAKH